MTIGCNICDESLTTRDVAKAIAFDREHTAEHATVEPTNPDPQPTTEDAS